MHLMNPMRCKYTFPYVKNNRTDYCNISDRRIIQIHVLAYTCTPIKLILFLQ